MIYWIQITSGRGPVECCWVVTRLSEQIIKEAESKGIRCQTIDVIPGDKPKTARSILISCEGENVEAFVTTYSGTIQWIGQSMFRPHHKRKNWFVGVSVFSPPKTNESFNDEIKIERMRASGPGGQHVNKTESAVRVTHIPSGLSAMAQEERSQHLNKKLALSRLNELLKQKENETLMENQNNRWSQHNQLERGNPVRIYEGETFVQSVK